MEITHSDVRVAVEAYVQDVGTNDASLVAEAFRPDARLWGFLGGDTPVTMPVSEFLGVVAGAPDPATWADGYRHRIRSVDVTGSVASAVLEETGYLGADFTNYFSLVLTDGKWKIATKTFILTAGALPQPGGN